MADTRNARDMSEAIEQLAMALPPRLEQGAGLLREIRSKTAADPTVLAALEMMAGEMEGAALVIRALYIPARDGAIPEKLNG